MAERFPVPHFPRPAPIETYGKGGFRFTEMSHRGSLLCLPNGIWGWPVVTFADINAETLAPVFEQAGDIGLFLLGAGAKSQSLHQELQVRFHQLKISVEVLRTGQAANTYNILLEESRRVACGLIAVD